jgi:hypothetical protein
VTIKELDTLISRVEFALEYEDYRPINDDLLKIILATRELIDALLKLEMDI